MKSYKYFTAAVAGLLLLNSCDMELVPKGATTLDTTEELEYMLNTANYKDNFPFRNIGIVANESYGDDYSSNVPGRIARGNSVMAAILSYDESIDRAALTSDDLFYTETYKLIFGLNVVIGKAGNTDGDKALKDRLIAEAKVERAYYHFLLANIYAAQYDPATASNKGGIAYVTDYNNANKKIQLPLDQVYTKILDDLDDDNIEILPTRSNVVRLNKYSGYAIKARVLLQMKKYPEALQYALKALEGNSNIEDRTPIVETHNWSLAPTADNNFWYISPQSTSKAVNYSQLTLETLAKVEPGDIVFNQAWAYGMESMPAFNLSYGQGDSGIPGCRELILYSVYTNVWGITVERIMYAAAECYIRGGEIQKGLDLVNKVRKFRIDADNYNDFTASNEKDAMALLQKAKFIECLSTYENFFDLKRWNSEDAYKQTITRSFPVQKDGEVTTASYSLSPDSPLWIFPFPSNVLEYNDSFSQNY